MSQLALSINIIATEARDAVRAAETLEDKIAAAMDVAHNHWMVLDEQTKFKGALAAVMLNVDDETRERIETEVRILNSFGAMFEGVPVDMAAALEADFEPIGLLKMWHAKTGADHKAQSE